MPHQIRRQFRVNVEYEAQGVTPNPQIEQKPQKFPSWLLGAAMCACVAVTMSIFGFAIYLGDPDLSRIAIAFDSDGGVGSVWEVEPANGPDVGQTIEGCADVHP